MRLFSRRPPKHPPVDPGFRAPKGQHYLDFLGRMQAALRPGWYLEVGTQYGKSLARAEGNAIAIDPDFRIRADIWRPRRQLHLFRMTSDDFFGSGFLAANGIRLDLAFLDGMHLVEFLLRDLMAAEKEAAPGAILALHDCVPLNHVMARRDWDQALTRQWTGDLWKILVILRKYRPDLTVTLADCAPTGLVLVSNLDPANRALDQAYEAILAEMIPLDLAAYGLEAFARDFPLVPAEAALAAATGRG